AGSSLVPCLGYSYGETEDYAVKIGLINELVTTGGGFYCSDSTATVTLTANALDPSIPHTILWVGPNGFTSNNTTLTFPQVAGASGPSGTYHVYLMSDPCGSNPDV